jgi:AAA domain
MTIAALGQWAQGFASWHKVLSAVPQETRALVFANACTEIAAYVAKGLDKVVAVDELASMASAHGLDDISAVQEIIAEAFRNVDVVSITDTNGKNGKHDGVAFRILSYEAFTAGFVPPDYLIDGILQRHFVYSLTGPTSHAKTAIALKLVELVASSNPHTWLGAHRVKKGQCCYLVGENPDDVRMRLIGAASRRADDPLHDRVFFIPGQINIGNCYRHLHDEFAKLGGLDLIIIDTSAAYFLGQDENANQQIGRHARMLRGLTELPGKPCVLVLCHPIKHAAEPDQLLPRGGGAFLAEMDGNLTCWKHDEVVTLHHTKMRGPGFEPITFRLETIRTPTLTDQEGRELPTVRAVPISRVEEDKVVDSARDEEDRALAALLKMPGASLSSLAEECGWTYQGEPAKSKVQRILVRLTVTKPVLVRKNRNLYELTEEGKKAAREAALRFLRQANAADQEPRLNLN